MLVELLSAILHAGRRYEPGERVDLPADAAERLCALGVCRSCDAAPSPGPAASVESRSAEPRRKRGR